MRAPRPPCSSSFFLYLVSFHLVSSPVSAPPVLCKTAAQLAYSTTTPTPPSAPLHLIDASSQSCSLPLPFAPNMLPGLPTEIIAHIIKQSLPALSFDTFHERYDTLRNFHLVNKEWNALAQRELFKHVHLPTSASAVKLQRIMDKQALASTLRYTATVWLGPRPGESDGVVLSNFACITRHCINVRAIFGQSLLVGFASDMWLWQGKSCFRVSEICSSDTFTPTDASALHLQDLALGLEMGGTICSIDFPPAQPFEQLTHLALVDPFLSSSVAEQWTSWLCPTVLPSLNSLALINTGNKWFQDFGDPATVLEALGSLAPQLKSFAFGEGDFRDFPNMPDFEQLWNKLKQLRSLYLETSLLAWDQDDFCLDNLATSALQHLSFRTSYYRRNPPLEDLEAASTLLELAPQHLASLQTITCFNWPEEELSYHWSDEETTVRDELRQVLKARNTQLVFSKQSVDFLSPSSWRLVSAS